MTPDEFALSLRTAVVEEGTALYRELFATTSAAEASDAYWKRALTFFGSLSLEQREIFFEIVRQVSVDTTSHVLGVLDGVSALCEEQAEFKLLCGGDQVLNGDLQDLFLAAEEDQASQIG